MISITDEALELLHDYIEAPTDDDLTFEDLLHDAIDAPTDDDL